MKKAVLFFLLVFGFVFSVFGQNDGMNEIREYAKSFSSGYRYAVMKFNIKWYTRDSVNAAWFDEYKESGNPKIVINRVRNSRKVDGATLVNEYKFETTYCIKGVDIVVSLDASLQFVDTPVSVDRYAPPYLKENQYERRKNVDEPSGKYRLNEYGVVNEAEVIANAFIKLVENVRARRAPDVK